VTATVEETLAWEAEQRPRAGWAAIVAGVLTLVGNVLLTVLTRGGPAEDEGFISVTEALSSRLAGQTPQGESLLVRQVDFFGDKVVPLTLSTILTTAAVILTALMLIYLYRATLARNEQLGRGPLISVVIGAVAFTVGHLVREIAQWVGAANFADKAERTAETAREVFQAPFVAAGSILELIGSFALAVGFVLVALNAMRVGLLTRFLGILGVIVGALTVFQLDQPQIVRAFWLAMVGLVILGRNPGGQPPAWKTGRAEPWPSQQQLAEARRAARGGPAEPTNGSGDVEDAAAPAQPKRKRKRRR
jgi:hypothetical protein